MTDGMVVAEFGADWTPDRTVILEDVGIPARIMAS